MGEVIYLDHRQSEIVNVVENLFNKAQQAEVDCILLTVINSEGEITYSRAGKILHAEDVLKLIGSMEHHKDYLMEKLKQHIALDEFETEEEAEEEEEDTE